MDNQHQKIGGYRDFNQDTVDKINKIKAKEAEVAELWKELQCDPDVDQRALAIAKTELQAAFSWFVRSVAKPADPFAGNVDATSAAGPTTLKG